MRTWHAEMAFVALSLAGVVIATNGGALEWLGAAAVLLSFGHAQVADRLAEREAARERPSVECHQMATGYLVGKESLWFAYFVLHQSWSALVGVVLFIAYPLWRRAWRARNPIPFDNDRVLNAAARKRLVSLVDPDPRVVDALRIVVRKTGGWP